MRRKARGSNRRAGAHIGQALHFSSFAFARSDLTRSRRERAARLLCEIFGIDLDPFVSKMRGATPKLEHFNGID